MHDLPVDPQWNRYVRIEQNIIGITARLQSPTVSPDRKSRLRGTLSAQQIAAARIAAMLQGAPGQYIAPIRMSRRTPEEAGYGFGV